MIYNNYPDDYIVINAKWVEWDNDNECWCFMTEDAFEKAQSLADYTKQVRKEVCEEIKKNADVILEEGVYENYMTGEKAIMTKTIYNIDEVKLDQIQGE